MRAPSGAIAGRVCQRINLQTAIRGGSRPGILISQDPRGSACGIVKLATSQGPDERSESHPRQQNCSRQHVEKHIHDLPSFSFMIDSRNAFSVTMAEDEDMAAAATMGVAHPTTAIGIAARL